MYRTSIGVVQKPKSLTGNGSSHEPKARPFLSFEKFEVRVSFSSVSFDLTLFKEKYRTIA